MLNGLMKSKFYMKCKPAIKLTKTRIEIIMKKRNSMQKYLMGDIADLLKNRLDAKAYERAEGFYAETNLSACYTFVEKSCDFVNESLSAMDKQGDCPEECKEAVSSLIFAAARFADLPELRDLRTTFVGRYGNSLDANCSKEFVEKLKARTPTEDMKIQILKDIALEYSIEWPSKPLERKLPINHLPSQQDHRVKNTMDVGKSNNNDMDEAILARRRRRKEIDEKNRETKGTLVERKPLKPPHGHQKVEDHLKRANNAAIEKTELPKPLKLPLPLPPGRQHARGIVVKGETSLSRKADKEEEEEQISRNNKSKEKEEDEMTMDRLLMHYSKKQSPYKQREVEESLKHHHPVDRVEKGGGDRESRRRKKNRDDTRHARGISLPPQQPMSSEREGVKISKQRMLSLSPTGNVHPNLPDYDDFIARFAAFKGN
ncbi:uncharacterized protein LOC124915297 [Impatiens glandulifera]|uniref:uncharacterized protein LOC124915297 n=1 Tax=Impatiens glandulifera TaxID=253017 RepID=UPI001FB0D613|nr:uncharacterized protein LOC124915297 [Impatiens glandulifera]